MNCQTVYDNLIINAQNRPVPDGYTERHHIIPRSLGGSDDQGNIVHLTAREHFIAHLLLAKIYGGPMIAAAWLLANLSGRKINARQYAWLKEAFSHRQSEINTGKRHTDETKKKISEVQKGKYHTEETKQKMSEKRKGKPWSEARRQAFLVSKEVKS